MSYFKLKASELPKMAPLLDKLFRMFPSRFHLIVFFKYLHEGLARTYTRAFFGPYTSCPDLPNYNYSKVKIQYKGFIAESIVVKNPVAQSFLSPANKTKTLKPI